MDLKRSPEIFEKWIKEYIVPDHKYADKIAHVLAVELISSDQGVENLVNASVGKIKSLADLDLKEGDRFTCEPDHLHDWDFDIPAMQKAGMLLGGQLEVFVVGIDITRRNPIKVGYKYIDKTHLRESYKESCVSPTVLTEDEL